MKKYLINGLLALVVGVILASCKDTSVDYVPIAQQKTQAYADVFKEMIGGEIDPNQNWGFDVTYPEDLDSTASSAGSRAGTRGECGECIKKDFNNYPAPGPYAIQDAERTYVLNWFKTHPGLTEQGLNISNYYIQHVWGQANKTYNLSWEGHDNTTAQATMDYFEVGDGSNYTHVLDLNSNSGGTWGVVYMQNSSALSFRYHATWGTGDSHYTNFKLAEIDVPNIGKGYYVGLAMYAHKYDNGDQVLNYDSLQYADDWILKIIPGEIKNIGGEDNSNETNIKKETIKRKRVMKQGRVFCEDLAKATRADIDFNDIVFDARIWKITQFERTTTNGNVADGPESFLKYEAEICLLAAGGTIPAKVAGKDVHNVFGVGGTTMVNTVDENSNLTISWSNSNVNAEVQTFTYDITDAVSNNGGGISLALIPIEVLWTSSLDDGKNGTMQTVGLIGANIGNVPYKLCVPIGTPWPSERVSIDEAYSGFSNWAKNAANTPNWNNGTKVINRNSPLVSDGKVVNDYVDEVTSSSSSKTTVTESYLWQGSSAMVYPEGGDNGLEMTFSTNDIRIGDKLRIYGTISNSNAYLVLKNSNWNDIVGIDLSNLNNYKEISVDQNMINQMTSTTINSWGRSCRITKITRVRTTVE